MLSRILRQFKGDKADTGSGDKRHSNPVEPVNAQQMRQKAKALFDEGKYLDAIQVISEMPVADQNRFNILMIRAQSEDSLGNQERALRYYRIANQQKPDRPGPKNWLARQERAMTDTRLRSLLKEAIGNLDAAIEEGNLEACEGEIQRIRETEKDFALVDWSREVLLAKAAHFMFCSDPGRAIASYDPDIIDISVKFGYLVWPKRIQPRIMARNVLDVGCGFGGYGNAFLAAGAASYTGLDPAMDLDSRRAKNKLIREWDEMPRTPREIMDGNPSINLMQGKSEDFKLGEKFDLIAMHNVTEHLMDIDAVFKGFVPLMHAGSEIVFLHHAYYGWNGHHQKPVKPGNYDPADDNQSMLADWQHVINVNNLPPKNYIYKGLNRITLDELKVVTNRYFEIDVWDETPSGEDVLSRLTPEIIQKAKLSVPQITDRDLSIHTVFCVATLK